VGLDRKENIKQTVKRLMFIYPGKVVAKKGKESRKWAMITEAFFSGQSQG